MCYPYRAGIVYWVGYFISNDIVPGSSTVHSEWLLFIGPGTVLLWNGDEQCSVRGCIACICMLSLRYCRRGH